MIQNNKNTSMLFRHSFLTLIALLTMCSVHTQTPTDTWLTVGKVTVAGQGNMTPVGRWFRLDADGHVSGGNGGIIHSPGTYSITGDSLLFYNEYGSPDPYGAFRQKASGDTITWNRTEEGMAVTVYLIPTDSRPQGPWDRIQGAWERSDLPGAQIYLRWDREFRLRGDWLGEVRRGVWHIRAHNPELRMISEGDAPVAHDFTIAFPEPGQMTWTNGDEVWVFNRVPE